MPRLAARRGRALVAGAVPRRPERPTSTATSWPKRSPSCCSTDGVCVFRDLAMHDSLRFPWRDLQWALRRLEDRGLVRGGRFVTGFSGEQYALPEAHRAAHPGPQGSRARANGSTVNATDPLNLVGRDRPRRTGAARSAPAGSPTSTASSRAPPTPSTHGAPDAREDPCVSTLQAPAHEYGDYADAARGLLRPGLDRRPAGRAADAGAGRRSSSPSPGSIPTSCSARCPTREVVVTAEHAAINAVMAGCRPEYMPVVVAAVRAHLQREGQLPQHHRHAVGRGAGGRSSTVRRATQLDVNCTAGCFGPGWRANATIGRALRLVIRNVCRAIPNFLDRATFSTPARYSFCFGEDEEGSDRGCR